VACSVTSLVLSFLFLIWASEESVRVMERSELEDNHSSPCAGEVKNRSFVYDGVIPTSQNCGLYGPIVHSRVTVMGTIV
jgi:hypothetical protein